MSPRYQLGATAYTYNAEEVDGFSASAAATANTLLALDATLDFDLGTGDISATEAVFAGALETLNFDEDITAIVDGQLASLNLTDAINQTVSQKIEAAGFEEMIAEALDNYDVLGILSADSQATMNQLGVDVAISDAITAYDLQNQEGITEMLTQIEDIELTLADVITSVDSLETNVATLEERIALLEELQGTATDEVQAATQTTVSDLSVSELPEFTEGIIVKKHAVFGEDTIGRVKILVGDTEARVEFAEEYEYQPIVTATVRGEAALNQNFRYTVLDENNEGFTIKLDHTVAEDIEFNWHAFAVDEGKIYVSSGEVEDIEIEIVEKEEVEEIEVIEVIDVVEVVIEEPEIVEVVEEVEVIEEVDVAGPTIEEVVEVVEEVEVIEEVVEEPEIVEVVEEVVEEPEIVEEVEEVVEEPEVVEVVEEVEVVEVTIE